MAQEIVEFALGINWDVMRGPLATAQAEALAAFKAAGNDLKKK